MIELKNITKIYKTKDLENRALDDVNLSFENNGFVFVLGPSGSGKSTMLNLIGGLAKYDSGSILIDGKDISDYNSIELDRYKNENIGFIFQNYNIINHLNIFENIALPLRLNKIDNKTIKKRVFDLVDRLGLKEKVNKMPYQLSGGQLQRVAIARALINSPKVILADEPTGALDTKNTKIIMDYLKEISKDHLIIMVSHNEQLATSYADRIIRLLDGKVESIENKCELVNISDNNIENKHFKYISFKTSFKLSFMNIYKKLFRSLLTLLGMTIGIVSACLVIMVSNSMNNYSEYAQKQALGTYPITISSNVTNDEIENDKTIYPEYPNTNKINIVNNYTSYYSHINVFSNDYLNYLNSLDKDLYTVMDFGSSLNMHILSNTQYGYLYLSNSSYLKVMDDSSSYINDEYELLYGNSTPNSMYDLALVIDKNNCIDAYVLDYIGIDYEDIESYTFEEICNKEFKVIDNNTYYEYNSDLDRYLTNSLNREDIYNNASITLRISCILRAKKNATNKLYGTGLLYTRSLYDYMKENNANSDIVKDQLKYGLSKNVFTGLEYKDSVSTFSTISKEYLLESNLRSLGYYSNISYIRIYTNNFENRSKINDYLEAYNKDLDIDNQVIYRDYMGTMTEEFSKFVEILTKVLIIFSSISLLVSCIMIALLMYVGVNERIKEIGILRCIGYSKYNVAITFLTESGIIGFTSGVLGLIISMLSIKPILRFVSSAVEELYSESFDISELTRVNLEFNQILLILLSSILIALIAALIPAIIGSKKEPVVAIRNSSD